MQKHRAIAIIPARAQSSRFPLKPLALIKNRPMIWHVHSAALRASRLDEVWVATDDTRISEVVRSWGGKVAMTPPDLRSGTDRVAYVARELEGDIILNIQGDEPLIDSMDIDSLVDALAEEEGAQMATLAFQVPLSEGLNDRNTVTVVTDLKGDALYFSRSVMRSHESFAYKHIGIYGFKKESLKQFCALPESPLEKAERLEQLRALENNMRIKVVRASRDTIAVDTPADIALVENYLDRTSKDRPTT